jgi:hypothetical protein
MSNNAYIAIVLAVLVLWTCGDMIVMIMWLPFKIMMKLFGKRQQQLHRSLRRSVQHK